MLNILSQSIKPSIEQIANAVREKIIISHQQGNPYYRKYFLIGECFECSKELANEL